MSVSRPARSLFSKTPTPIIRPHRCRNFNTSPSLYERRRPRFPSVKAADMGLVTSKQKADALFKPYSEKDHDFIKQNYTPAQIKAIEAGEKAVTAQDLDRHGVVRTDMGSLPYFDDFKELETVLDRKPQVEVPNDPKARMATEDEFGFAFVKWLDKIKELEPPGLTRSDPDFHKKMRPNRADFTRFTHEINAVVDSKGLQDPYPLSQFKPKSETPEQQEARERRDDELRYLQALEENDPRDQDGVYNLLRKQTGITFEEIAALKTKVLVLHRVVNQTRLGKIDSQYCLAIAGNQKGRLGLGQAKASEADAAQNLAKIAAIKNMRPISRYEERTIFGEVKGKVSASVVTLESKPPGFGLRCQHIIFEMARLAGIHDLAARVPRSRNKMNTAKAAYQALTNQILPEDVARGRGKKMVDVRKVYYAGRV